MCTVHSAQKLCRKVPGSSSDEWMCNENNVTSRFTCILCLIRDEKKKNRRRFFSSLKFCCGNSSLGLCCVSLSIASPQPERVRRGGRHGKKNIERYYNINMHNALETYYVYVIHLCTDVYNIMLMRLWFRTRKVVLVVYHSDGMVDFIPVTVWCMHIRLLACSV